MNLAALEPWSVFLIVFFSVLFATLFLKRLIWSRLLIWSNKAENTWAQSLLVGSETPTKYIVFGLTLAFANHFAPDTFKHQSFIALGLRIYFVLICIWLADRLATAALNAHPYLKALAPGTVQLIQFAIRILVFCLGLLIILDNLGISITPLLASLGVGSVAVALALQDTLNNFFSGVYVLADQPIRIDDYIKLEDGTEGNVVHIGWRSTKIRLGSNNYVVVPNKNIASAQLTNYNFPTEASTFSIEVRVGYDCDLKNVEVVALRVAKAVAQSCPEAVSIYEPLVRFHTFADSSINFSVVMQAKRYPDVGLIKHEFIKQLHLAFKTERIDIPYPHRVFLRTLADGGRDSSPTL